MNIADEAKMNLKASEVLKLHPIDIFVVKEFGEGVCGLHDVLLI